MTAAIGVFSFFWLPPSPTQTKGILRGKDGWFNEREEIIMVNRILRYLAVTTDPRLGLLRFWYS